MADKNDGIGPVPTDEELLHFLESSTDSEQASALAAIGKSPELQRRLRSLVTIDTWLRLHPFQTGEAMREGDRATGQSTIAEIPEALEHRLQELLREARQQHPVSAFGALQRRPGATGDRPSGGKGEPKRIPSWHRMAASLGVALIIGVAWLILVQRETRDDLVWRTGHEISAPTRPPMVVWLVLPGNVTPVTRIPTQDSDGTWQLTVPANATIELRVSRPDLGGNSAWHASGRLWRERPDAERVQLPVPLLEAHGGSDALDASLGAPLQLEALPAYGFSPGDTLLVDVNRGDGSSPLYLRLLIGAP